MKFEKFVKKVMPHGKTLRIAGEKYLTDDVVAMKIPEWAGSFGVESDENEELNNVLEYGEWGHDYAELTKAYLAYPDDKAKDIIRVFSDGVNKVCISNENFGLIEKTDKCLIATSDDGRRKALLVGKYAVIDEFDPDAVIFEIKEEER